MQQFIIYLLIFLLIPSCLVFPQTISSQLYENEGDLEEGFLSGELTYQEYLELLDLLQEGTSLNSLSKERLLFIPDMSQSQIDQLSDSLANELSTDKIFPFHSAASSFFLPEILNQTRGRFSFQTRQRFDQDYSYHFVLAKFKVKDRFLFNLQLQKENSFNPVVKKRSLEISNLSFSKRIALGNFDEKIGLGLNIGYHPLLKSEEEDQRNTFLYPVSGRFNGLLVESHFGFFSPELILSKDEKGDFSEEMWAINLLSSFRDFNFGIVRSEGKLKNTSNHSSFYDRNLSFYLKASKSIFRFSGEYSFLNTGEKGWASVLTFKDKPFLVELSGWNYSRNFLHLFGAGLSNPDYTTIKIDEVEYEYPAREMGESGMMLKSEYLLSPRLLLNFSYSQWKEATWSPTKLRQKVGLNFILSQRIKTRLEYFHSNSDLEEDANSQDLVSSSFIFNPWNDYFFRLITRYGKRKLPSISGERNSLEFQLRSDFQNFSPFHLTLWTRYKDNDLSKSKDGFWDFRVQQRLSFFQGSIFYGEYFIKSPLDSSDKTQGAKLRLEVGF